MTKGRLTPLLVGQCPDDWQQAFIDEVTELLTNGYVGPSLPFQTDDPEIGIRYLQGFNVRPNKVDFLNATWVTQEFHERNKKSCLREGDLLVVQSGHIGTAAVVPESAAGSNCHALIINRFQRDKVDPYFSCQYINSEIGQARLRGLQVGSSMLHINTSELGRFKLPLPPIVEQRRLAEILGMWDAAIVKTEQLIALRVKQKAWLLVQVISALGQTKKLGDFLKQVSRPVPKPAEPYWAVGIRSHGKGTFQRFVENPSSVDMEELYALNRDNLIVNITFAWEGAITMVKPDDEGCLVSHRFPTYEINREVADPRFVKYIVNCKEFFSQLALISPGGAGRNRVLNKKDFLKLTVSLPPIAEQKRLAHILGTLDQLIQIEADQLAAIKTQKRGLMQKLLTGQWRVNPDMTKEMQA